MTDQSGGSVTLSGSQEGPLNMSKLRMDRSRGQAVSVPQEDEIDGETMMERYNDASRKYGDLEDDCLEIGFNALEQSIGSPGSSILNDEDNRANEAPKLTSTPNKIDTDRDATPPVYYNPASDFLYRRSRGETQSQGIPDLAYHHSEG